jgi:hypothetical protein
MKDKSKLDELAEIRDAKVVDIIGNAANRVGQNAGAVATLAGFPTDGNQLHYKFSTKNTTAADRLGNWLGDLGTTTGAITAGNKLVATLPVATSVTLGALQFPGQTRNVANALADIAINEALNKGRAANEGIEYNKDIADGLSNAGGLVLDLADKKANFTKYALGRAGSKSFLKFMLNDADKRTNNEMYDIVERYLYEEAIKNLAEGRD